MALGTKPRVGIMALGLAAYWPQFDGMRASPEFASLLSDAEAGRRRALTAFREAGGQRLLGVRGPGL